MPITVNTRSATESQSVSCFMARDSQTSHVLASTTFLAGGDADTFMPPSNGTDDAPPRLAASRGSVPPSPRSVPCFHHSGPSSEAAILCRPAGKGARSPPETGCPVPHLCGAKIPNTWAKKYQPSGIGKLVSSWPTELWFGARCRRRRRGGRHGEASGYRGARPRHADKAQEKEGRLRHDRLRGFSPARRGGDPG